MKIITNQGGSMCGKSFTAQQHARRIKFKEGLVFAIVYPDRIEKIIDIDYEEVKEEEIKLLK